MSVCQWCGLSFKKKTRNSVFCSPRCQRNNTQFTAINKARESKAQPTVSKQKYVSVLHGKQSLRICKFCGGEYEALIDGKWCSVWCIDMANKLIWLNNYRKERGLPPLGVEHFTKEYFKAKYKKEGMADVNRMYKKQGASVR
jgi:hypothetical protein